MTTLGLLWELLSYKRRATEMLVKERIQHPGGASTRLSAEEKTRSVARRNGVRSEVVSNDSVKLLGIQRACTLPASTTWIQLLAMLVCDFVSVLEESLVETDGRCPCF